MKHLTHVQPRAQTHRLVDLARLVMDYETNRDFADGDLQNGVLIDMLRVIKFNPHQLLEITPSRVVARALCLALKRGMYAGKREAELLAAATYHCLSRAMAENPQDLSLYKERYGLLQDTGNFLSNPLQIASKGLHEEEKGPVLLQVKSWMLLTDLLYTEEFFEKGVIFSTQRRALMNKLDKANRAFTLYQHINMGLECHEKFTNYLEGILQLDEIWDFNNSTNISAKW